MFYYKTDGGFIASKRTISDGVEISKEEFYEVQKSVEKTNSDCWANIPYDEAVNAEIRKRYTESAEFAILRQKDEKPEEYAEYYSYCEECKALVKSKKEAAV